MSLTFQTGIEHAVPVSLDWAHPITREWFVQRFGTPTEPQIEGWPSIQAGHATLISAPTGSGKTLAAFLVCIDQLLRNAIAGTLSRHTEVVYISPLKALSNDIQKNLDQPLREIQQLALERGHLYGEIRTAVRTGDTLASERAAMLKKPPHILVTTPESLYILLTSKNSRENLRHVRTVIVDEIHAVADDKRGSHLALSLERLEALVCGENALRPGALEPSAMKPPQRIGLSATQNPIELVAQFLVGCSEDRKPAKIVQVGRRRAMDLAVEVPGCEELGSVATNAMWDEMYDRMAALAQEHRSTLVFVNTRRMVERLSHAVGERIGAENVAAHHGSLSRKLRLDAETRLKNGEIKLLVATASLELGIDIGAIDLVCQVGSTRAVAAGMQRIGRAGHWRGAIPKGRFFATTRDDLIECAALVQAMRAGDLDRLEIPPQPLDVLMQQMVAACAAESWKEDTLYSVLHRAYPYRDLTRGEFDELIQLLHRGIESSRGRYGAFVMRDAVHGELHARRGARLAAVCNGGTIPDTAQYAVIMQPEGLQIATLDEHFAIDSLAGDVILLGNTSWRIQRIETGRVFVEDAHGQPPNLPFWAGEAPQRTDVLSGHVARLREQIAARTPTVQPGHVSQAHAGVAEAAAWLKQECGVCDGGAEQMIGYIAAGRAALGAIPSLTTIVAERFFDEGGGMQLILHAPFGGRINKAWGLALRKRFCRGFNFELQAAATDNGLCISLAEQHSFPLSDVFQFLTVQTVQELLEQAALDSPIFKSRWTWAAGRSLQLLRFQKGKKVAPQILRTRSDDLLASVFPQVAACIENIQGDREIPDHPLVREVMKDVLGEAMDFAGLKGVLDGIRDGAIRCVAIDTTAPSVFAHELLNANPYAFLDDAPLEERRARAVSMRRALPASMQSDAGQFDPAAIATVRSECWPDLRDEHEMHDLLFQVVALPVTMLQRPEAYPWKPLLERLEGSGRASIAESQRGGHWVATENLAEARSLWPEGVNVTDIVSYSRAVMKLVQGWLQILGPVTASSLASLVGVAASDIFQTLLKLEMQGTVLRGTFENAGSPSSANFDIEWCERRLLQRIHRLTIGNLRKQIEPASASVYMQWVLGWQHLTPQSQLSGEQGVLQALTQLEGFEAPAIEWEKSLLARRVAGYDPRWLDQLCLSGAVGWGRVSPHPAWSAAEGGVPRKVVPTGMSPITFYIRETAAWLDAVLENQAVDEARLRQSLSSEAQQIRTRLEDRGACFVEELQRSADLTMEQVEHALWELTAAGLAAADGFDQLRAIMDPRRKSAAHVQRLSNPAKRPRSAAGRWYLLRNAAAPSATASQQARLDDQAMESAAWVLLRRYGVLFRDLLKRETTMPRWRELLGVLRRLEARGEVRGGRFVSGFSGEQYALPEAVESLRLARMRKADPSSVETIAVAAADPMNLVDIIVPGKRASAISGRLVTFQDGKSDTEISAASPETDSRASHPRTRNRVARHAPARKKMAPSDDRGGAGIEAHPERSRQERLFPA
ncbi:MAG: DEAD/DEAH box helicase [Acidobacteriaceae bacterium]